MRSSQERPTDTAYLLLHPTWMVYWLHPAQWAPGGEPEPPPSLLSHGTQPLWQVARAEPWAAHPSGAWRPTHEKEKRTIARRQALPLLQRQGVP